MTTIDKNKPIMVTGATGYVAGWLVKQLLEDGLTVHAAVRNPGRKEKTAHLDEIADASGGTIKYFKADLLDEGSYAEAMEGCELVYHTASPFTSNFEDPQRDLVDPAVLGTRNVLAQVNQTESVKRVVLTSSCASIYSDATELKDTPNGVFTEDIWNTTASLDYQPYSYSKTMAERAAWAINEKQSRWDLVVINPCLVMGPPLNLKANTSESFSLLKQLGDGSMKSGVPKVSIGLVDVRDVAEAHYQAGFRPRQKGGTSPAATIRTSWSWQKPCSRSTAKTTQCPRKPCPSGWSSSPAPCSTSRWTAASCATTSTTPGGRTIARVGKSWASATGPCRRRWRIRLMR